MHGRHDVPAGAAASVAAATGGHPLQDRHILPHGANTVDVESAIKYLGAATAHNHGQRARVPSLAWTPL